MIWAHRARATHALDLLHATGTAAAFGKCHNRIRPFGGVSRFQREQAMDEDTRKSIRRASIESAIFAQRRSIWQLVSKAAVDN